MILVLVVALVVVGPKDLPKLMRKMGQWTAKARNMADQFRRSFDDMARQSELDELRKELEDLKNSRPLAGVDEQMSAALAGPVVNFEPEPKPAAAEAPGAPAPGAPAQAELELVPPDAHGEPPVPSPEPAEPIAPGDQHPLPP